MSDVRNLQNRRPTDFDSDRHQNWSARTIGSRRRGDITEPVSERALAVWVASRLSAIR